LLDISVTYSAGLQCLCRNSADAIDQHASRDSRLWLSDYSCVDT